MPEVQWAGHRWVAGHSTRQYYSGNRHPRRGGDLYRVRGQARGHSPVFCRSRVSPGRMAMGHQTRRPNRKNSPMIRSLRGFIRNPHFEHLSDKTHKSCKVLNSAHICTQDRSSLIVVQTSIKSRNHKASQAPKTILIDAAKAAKAGTGRAPRASRKTLAAKVANGHFAPMEFLAKVGAAPHDCGSE